VGIGEGSRCCSTNQGRGFSEGQRTGETQLIEPANPLIALIAGELSTSSFSVAALFYTNDRFSSFDFATFALDSDTTLSF
jgi:hypothetical protein